MDPDEVEFLGENQLIGIIPNFDSDTIHLISGDVGPIQSGIATKVPLWMAVNLKQQQKCKFVIPDWMNKESLEDAKDEEKRSRFFTKMPSEHYMIEAKLILACASEDIPFADEIRTIIKDIWDMRMSKLRTSMDIFIRGDNSYAKLDHLTLMEINSVRPLLPHALDQLERLRNSPNNPGASQHISTPSTNTTPGL